MEGLEMDVIGELKECINNLRNDGDVLSFPIGSYIKEIDILLDFAQNAVDSGGELPGKHKHPDYSKPENKYAELSKFMCGENSGIDTCLPAYTLLKQENARLQADNERLRGIDSKLSK